MADMTTYEMLDDVDLSIESKRVTDKTKAIAGYVNGEFANWPAIVAKYGKAGVFLLSIDVQGNPAVGAQCLDVEKGDVPPGNHAAIVAWVKATRANGIKAKDLRYYPKVYTSEANAESVTDALTAAGVARDTYMLWTAHYGEEAHICGPSSCGCKVQADATQYTDSADGVSLDASLCYGYFFAGPADSVPPAAPKAPGKLAASELHSYPSYRGVTLEWAAVPGATEYDVQLLQGTAQAGRASVKELKAEFEVKAETAYTWRVSAQPGGDWSEAAGFTAPKAPEGVTTAPKPPVVVEVPQPSPGPVEAATGVRVYVQEVLAAGESSKLGLPAGTILFIPHTVKGES